MKMNNHLNMMVVFVLPGPCRPHRGGMGVVIAIEMVMVEAAERKWMGDQYSSPREE